METLRFCPSSHSDVYPCKYYLTVLHCSRKYIVIMKYVLSLSFSLKSKRDVNSDYLRRLDSNLA